MANPKKEKKKRKKLEGFFFGYSLLQLKKITHIFFFPLFPPQHLLSLPTRARDAQNLKPKIEKVKILKRTKANLDSFTLLELSGVDKNGHPRWRFGPVTDRAVTVVFPEPFDAPQVLVAR